MLNKAYCGEGNEDARLRESLQCKKLYSLDTDTDARKWQESESNLFIYNVLDYG